jgi:hypothetical protein
MCALFKLLLTDRSMYRQNQQSKDKTQFFKVITACAPKINFLPYRKQNGSQLQNQTC